MPFEYPKNLARFYDVIYHHLRDSTDSEFYLNEIRKVNGRVLEIGAGTGRLFTSALNRGSDIYGLDISQSMIDVLLKKLDKEHHHRISLQNMIDFSYDFGFDLIIVPFRVIMHVQEKEDQLKALNNIYKHLNNNGRLIFDVFVPDLNHLIKGMDNFVDFEKEYEPGKRILRTVSMNHDLIRQVMHITFHLEWDERNSTEHEDWKFDMRYFFRYELEHLMERSDFDSYRILGDFEGHELNQESKEFVVIGRKI